jgi:OFA family oxalate/formate antiporter-like MFS transporter
MWQDRVGPRVVASVGGVLYGCGYLVAAWAVARHSLPGMYAGYGVVAGLGMGMAYICPVATLVKWFPDRKGLMTGIAVCGYGAGALVMSPVAARAAASAGVPATFAGLGLVYLAVVLLTARAYRNPPAGWAPAGFTPPAATGAEDVFTVAEALRTPQFWLLWMMLFLNVSAGIAVISQASPMAQQLAGLTPLEAASLVGVISVFNGLGRVAWAAASDVIGRRTVFVVLYAVQAVVLATLPSMHSAVPFGAAVALVGFCYGGAFGTLPSFTADWFGSKAMGGIYGWILLAWGAAGIPAPMFVAHVRQASGEYAGALRTLGAVLLVAIALPLLARPPRKRAARRPAGGMQKLSYHHMI